MTDLKETTGHVCARRLLGRCQRRGWEEQCIFPPGNDHPTLWLRDGKPCAFVFEPYELWTKRLRELLAFCDEHGFDLSIDGRSTWNPGETCRVVLTRCGEHAPAQRIGLRPRTYRNQEASAIAEAERWCGRWKQLRVVKPIVEAIAAVRTAVGGNR